MEIKYVPLSDAIGDAWPQTLGTVTDIISDVLDRIGVGQVSVDNDERGLPKGVKVQLALLADVEKLSLPFLPGFTLGLDQLNNSEPFIARFSSEPHLSVEITGLKLTLRMPPNLLQTWRRVGSRWEPVLGVDGKPKGFEFTITTGISIDLEIETISLSEVALDEPGADIGAMVSGAGFILKFDEPPQLILSDEPPGGLPEGVAPGFRGVALKKVSAFFVRDSSELPLDGKDKDGNTAATLELIDAAIGSGGFNGQIRLDFLGLEPAKLPGGQLFGIDCRLRSFDVTFTRSAPTASAIKALLKLPFFNDEGDLDKWLAVEAALGGPDGELLVRLSAAGQPGDIVRLRKEGLFELGIAALAFRLVSGKPGVEITGNFKPLILDDQFHWPTFDLNGLCIDSNGHVQLPGGSLRLPKAEHFDFYKFSTELSAISFGDLDLGGTTFSSIGFSGGIKLADDLAGAELRNLRVLWPRGSVGPPQVKLDGVTIAIDIKDVLALTGSVDFGDGEFAGSVQLALEKPFQLTAGVLFVVGSADDFNYWFLDTVIDLPVGIPLASTGLSVYGGEALAGRNWAPKRAPEMKWFEDWYLMPPIGVGVTPPAKPQDKWAPRADTWVFGAGIVLGTSADDGYKFNGKLLAVVTLSGPVIFIEGRAQWLEKRSKLSGNPPFRAIAILDFENEEFLIGVAAQFTLAEVIDVTGTAEAYFNLRNTSAWHVYLGVDDPESKRIRATVLSIINSAAFFMIDARSVRTGMAVQYGRSFRFGPLRLVLKGRLEEKVEIFWQPFRLAGFVGLQGQVRLSAFGFGVSLSVEANLQTIAPKRFEVSGSFKVKLDLPWPMRDLSATVSFRWRKEDLFDPWLPPLNLVVLFHPHSGRAWDVLAELDLPGLPPRLDQTVPVPLDAHPALTFGRPMNPERSVAGIPPVSGLARPGTLGFTGERLPAVAGNFVSIVKSVTLSRWNGEVWEPIAESEDPSDPWDGVVDLKRAVWGTWHDIQDRNGDWAAMQFEMWNRYAFARHDDLNDKYRGGTLGQYGKELCDVGETGGPHCADFLDQPAGRVFERVFLHSPGIFTASRTIGIGQRADVAFPRVLWMRPLSRLLLDLDEPLSYIEIDLSPYSSLFNVTTWSGDDQIETRGIHAPGVYRFEGASGHPITRVQFDANLNSGQDTPLYRSDTGTTEKTPSPEIPTGEMPGNCLWLLESLVPALLPVPARPGFPFDKRTQPSVPGQPGIPGGGLFPPPPKWTPPNWSEVDARLSDLAGCEIFPHRCLPLLEKIQPLIRSYRNSIDPVFKAPKPPFDTWPLIIVSRSPFPTGIDPCRAFSQLMAVLRDLEICMIDDWLAELPEGSCVDLEDPVRQLGAAVNDLAERMVCREGQPIPDTDRVHRAVLDARVARERLALCKRAEPAFPDPIITGVGDPDDANHWLRAIPGLTSTGIPAAGGADLRRFCWVTAREAAYPDIANEMKKRFENIASQFQADEILLEPRTSYKLTVRTRQENASFTPTAREWTDAFYFRTLGGAGDYINDEEVLKNKPELRAFDTLAQYLKATVPAANAQAIYRDYGFAVVFNEPYVEGMYKGFNQNLRLVLLGPDDKPVIDQNGAPIALAVVWTQADSATLQPFQRILGQTLPGSGCDIALPPPRRDGRAQADLPAGFSLAPLTRYTVQLRAGLVGSEREVGRFSFTTGRYANFADQVADAGDLGPILTAPDGASSLLQMLRPQSPYDPDAEALAFASALELLGLAPRLPPARLSSALLEIGITQPVILLESPQPLGFRRLSFKLFIEPELVIEPPGAEPGDPVPRRGGAITPVTLRSGDGMRVLLATPEMNDLRDKRVTVLMTFSMAVLDPARFPDEPKLVFGGKTQEVAEATFRYRRAR